jgi:predicted HicB family RNase H-like nuclease
MATVAARLAAMTREQEDSRSRVITVRLPPSLHARLKDAAYASRVSLNRLCTAALIEAAEEIEAEHLPVARAS